MKRARKSISILLSLTMLIGLLLPIGTASAITKNTLNSVPTVNTDYNSVTVANSIYSALTSLDITEDSNAANDFKSGKTFIVTLPAGLEFVNPNGELVTSATDTNNAFAGVTPVQYVKSTGTPDNVVTGNTYATATYSGTRALNITFGAAADASSKDAVRINFFVKVTGASGDLTATIDSLDSGVNGGNVVIGRVASGEVEGSALSVENIGEVNNAKVGMIRLTESTPGALTYGDSVKLKLPAGFAWAIAGSNTAVTNGNGSATTLVSYTSGFSSTDFNITRDTDGRRLILTKITNTVTLNRGVIDIQGITEVKSDAKQGDVVVNLSGDDVTDADLTVAIYGDYGVKVTSETTPDVTAGSFESDLGKFFLEESVPGSLVASRKVYIELSDGAKFNPTGSATSNKVTSVKGSNPLSSFVVDSSDLSKIEATVSGTPTTGTPAKLEITLKNVNIEAGTTGDITATISGSAVGEEQSVVVAKAAASVEVTATSAKIQLGLNNQAAGDIVIKENAAGTILDKNKKVGANNDGHYGDLNDKTTMNTIYVDINSTGTVKFATTPTVEVQDGDIEIDSVSKSTNDTRLQIKVKSSSTKASAIKISNIKLNVERTVPTGDIEFKIAGPALNQVYDADNNGATTQWFDTAAVAKVYPANVTNAAPTAGSATFKIGSTIYYENGVAKVMDAAPYIKNSRTYVPVRYLAYALGVDESDIAYDGSVVTIVKGDTTLKLTIGAKTIDNNGTMSAMDVAPEVVNGRTMLPARYVAEGFGAAVGYDAGTVVISQ